MAKNTGVINKLRHFVCIHILKQLYCTLIYPYLNYGMSWGTACPTRLDKIKTKQNKCLRAIFFSRTNENVTAYFQLLKILKLENIFNLQISSLVYKIIIRKTYVPKALINLTMEASDVHSYNTRYASKQNLYRPASKTNYGLTGFKTKASKIWGKIPKQIKSLPFCSFKKQYKIFLNNQVELGTGH
jgi:hypothetical protein